MALTARFEPFYSHYLKMRALNCKIYVNYLFKFFGFCGILNHYGKLQIKSNGGNLTRVWRYIYVG